MTRSSSDPADTTSGFNPGRAFSFYMVVNHCVRVVSYSAKEIAFGVWTPQFLGTKVGFDQSMPCRQL